MEPISDLAYPVFSTGLTITSRPVTDASLLQRELLDAMQAFRDSATKAGHPGGLVDEARYALMAWLDEIVFSETSLSFEWLGYSLVVKEFNDQAAGDGFFTRLERLHKESSKVDVLRLYGHCLLLGFRGRYRMESDDKVAELIDQVFAKVPGASTLQFAKAMTPAGKVPNERNGKWLLVASLTLLAIGATTYATLAYLAQSGS